jgi:DNA-binding LacI/PurR family transcriptional regulator
VYFDFAGIGSEITRSTMGLRRSFYSLFFDEDAAVELALRCLTGAGHTRVAFATLQAPGYDWAFKRRDRMVSIAAAPLLRIDTIVLAEPFWQPSGESDVDKFATFNTQLDAYLRKRESAAAPAAKKACSRLRRVLAQTPSVSSLLNSGATAVISANDRIAHLFWLFAKAAGIPVPGRLSMVSFDNLPESIYFPITTIDFGFARLGYLAAHILLDDLPASADRQGTIAAVPQLIERGSVASPKAQSR